MKNSRMVKRNAKTILNNGVRVLTQQVPHVRSISMGIWVNAGARDESQSEGGLSHLIEHMIFKGTQRRDAFAIAKAFDAIGGQANAFTSMEYTCYHAKVMDIHLATMVDILTDIFLNSAIHPAELEKERPVILQEIGMVEDTPDEWAHTLLLKGMWPDHPLGRSILGSRENIERYDSQAVRLFLKKQYQPDRIVIAAVGNIQHQEFLDLIAPSFETIPQGAHIPERKPPITRPGFETCPRDTEQVHICIGTEGLSATDDRRFVLCLLNAILGGNMSSRLFQEIREKRGLAYSVYSFSASHEDTGVVGMYAGVAPEHAKIVTERLIQEWEKLVDHPVDDSDLQNAKQFVNGNMLLSLENTENIMFRIAQNEIHFGKAIPVQTVLDEVAAVTSDQISRLAQILHQEGRFAYSLLGPENCLDVFSG